MLRAVSGEVIFVGCWLTKHQCIEELRDKAAIFKKTGLINVLDGDLTIVKSDVAVSESARKALSEGVQKLEDVPDHQKDWHPGSDEMVLDLVHPSLFPVAYGLTKVLPDEKVPLDGCIKYIGKGVTIRSFTPQRLPPSNVPDPWLHEERPIEWGSFQWLPTDVEVTDTGARMLGYINNLHPEEHREMYTTLEQIVEKTIPLWEECLSGFYDRRRIKLEDTGESDYTYPEGLLYRIPGEPDGPRAWFDPNKDLLSNGESLPDDAWEWQCEDEFHDWKEQNRILTYREPREYTPQAELTEGSEVPGADLRGKYPGGLQVIFKLASIHVTPEKPRYGGGSWHVEGGLNEMICASAIYYLDQENVSDSHLAFRQSLEEQEIGLIPEQGHWASLEAYMGIEQDGPAVQRIGSVLTKEGRLLAFPNSVQHQVQPFELMDKGRKGHRKILAMFLVDPQRRVLSTSNVPPQRRDWWGEELHREGSLRELPAELVQHTVGLVDDFPVSWEKAVEMREKLIKERGLGNDAVTEQMYAVSCDDLCYLILCVDGILTVNSSGSPFASTEAEAHGSNKLTRSMRRCFGAIIKRYYRELQQQCLLTRILTTDEPQKGCILRVNYHLLPLACMGWPAFQIDSLACQCVSLQSNRSPSVSTNVIDLPTSTVPFSNM